MNEACLQFHIEQNDYFGTLATVLDLVSQDLRKKGHRSNAETLGSLRDQLMFLQQGYRIEKIHLHCEVAKPAMVSVIRKSESRFARGPAPGDIRT